MRSTSMRALFLLLWCPLAMGASVCKKTVDYQGGSLCANDTLWGVARGKQASDKIWRNFQIRKGCGNGGAITFGYLGSFGYSRSQDEPQIGDKTTVIDSTHA